MGRQGYCYKVRIMGFSSVRSYDQWGRGLVQLSRRLVGPNKKEEKMASSLEENFRGGQDRLERKT